MYMMRRVERYFIFDCRCNSFQVKLLKVNETKNLRCYILRTIGPTIKDEVPLDSPRHPDYYIFPCFFFQEENLYF